MKDFQYIEDVDDWLEPMDYTGFWYAIALYDLDDLALQDRAHCDGQLARGEVDQETMLYCLKNMARMELTLRHDLKHRIATPWLKLVASH